MSSLNTPIGWDCAILADVLATPIRNGYSPNCPDNPNGFWLLGLGALTDHGFNTTELKPAPLNDPLLAGFILQAGDFLISRSNTLDKVGRSILFKGEIANCYYPDLMMRFRIDETVVFPEFMEYYLRGTIAKRHYVQSAAGTSGSMKKINKRSLERLPLTLPPLPEQRKIAEILSTWDRAIELTRRLIEAKQRRKQALMQRLLTGKVRFPGFTEPWEEVRLGEVCSTFSGGTPSRANGDYFNGTIPWMKSAEVNQRYVTDVEETISEEALRISSAKIVERETVLIALYGATAGKVAITKVRSAINQAILAVIPEPHQLDNIFLFHYLELSSEQLLKIVQGGQPNLSGKIVSSSKLRYPQLFEQRKIAEVLSVSDREIESLEQLKAHQQQQKKGLMQQLLTGKIRVKVEEE